MASRQWSLMNSSACVPCTAATAARTSRAMAAGSSCLKRSCTVGTPARAMRPTHAASGSTAYRPSRCGQAGKPARSARACTPKSCGLQGHSVASKAPRRWLWRIQACARHSASMPMKPSWLQAARAARYTGSSLVGAGAGCAGKSAKRAPCAAVMACAPARQSEREGMLLMPCRGARRACRAPGCWAARPAAAPWHRRGVRRGRRPRRWQRRWPWPRGLATRPRQC